MAPKKNNQDRAVPLPPGRVQVQDGGASSSRAPVLPLSPPARSVDVTGSGGPAKKKMRMANMLRAK